MAAYIRVSEAARRLGCSVQTIYQSRIGMAATVPGTRPKLVDWEMLRGSFVVRPVGRPPLLGPKTKPKAKAKPICKPKTKPKTEIDPYWLRRGDTSSLSSQSSSLQAGEVYL